MLKNPPKKEILQHDKPKNIVIKTLHFDKKQIQSYENLIKNHRAQIHKNDEQMLELKKKLYQLLNTENSRVAADSIVLKMGKLQSEIELIHYNHFLDIKALCKPEQLAYFNALSTEINAVFFPPHRRK